MWDPLTISFFNNCTKSFYEAFPVDIQLNAKVNGFFYFGWQISASHGWKGLWLLFSFLRIICKMRHFLTFNRIDYVTVNFIFYWLLNFTLNCDSLCVTSGAIIPTCLWSHADYGRLQGLFCQNVNIKYRYQPRRELANNHPKEQESVQIWDLNVCFSWLHHVCVVSFLLWEKWNHDFSPMFCAQQCTFDVSVSK